MISYKPSPYQYGRLAQTPAAPAAAPAPVMAYTGVPGFLETVAVLGIVGSAAWVGVRTATSKQQNQYVKAAGWVGGVGSALIGLLYLGQKTGMSMGLPKVTVTG